MRIRVRDVDGVSRLQMHQTFIVVRTFITGRGSPLRARHAHAGPSAHSLPEKEREMCWRMHSGMSMSCSPADVIPAT